MPEFSVLTVAGLIGEETVERGELTLTHLGGSGCYAALGASLFGPTQLIGIADERCLDDLSALSNRLDIDISQVQICPGRGFRYSISYEDDNHCLRSFQADWGMNPLLDYALNVPSVGMKAFLAADDPARQLRLVRHHPGLVYGVGVNEHFIPDFRDEYLQLIENAKVVILNKREWELLSLTKLDDETTVIVTNGSLPIAVRCGRDSFEQGVLFERDVVDPTGCGDVLGGALFAMWASAGFTKDALREILSRAIQASHLALMSRGALGLMHLQAEAAVDKG